jgi:hypothetical protein
MPPPKKCYKSRVVYFSPVELFKQHNVYGFRCQEKWRVADSSWIEVGPASVPAMKRRPQRAALLPCSLNPDTRHLK